MCDNLEKECMICFYPVDINIELEYIKCYNCNHLFHKDCIFKWKEKTKCKHCVCIYCSKDDLFHHKVKKNCFYCFGFGQKSKYIKLITTVD